MLHSYMSTAEKVTTPGPPVSVQNLKSVVRQPTLGHRTQNYVCGHCKIHVGGLVVAYMLNSPTQWLLCTSCGHGSVQTEEDTIHPLPLPAPRVEDLPSEVGQAYDEARKTFAVQAHTGCELLCRKILMNVAVDKGADEGKKFAYYVNYLKDGGHITASMKGMADIVRENGNQATHEIKQPDKARVEMTLEFTANVLWSVYEAEHQLKKYENSKATT